MTSRHFATAQEGLAWLPRSQQHAFTVTSSTAHFLTITMPGGFEELFRTGAPAPRAVIPTGAPTEDDLQRAGSALRDLGVTILGPQPEL